MAREQWNHNRLCGTLYYRDDIYTANDNNNSVDDIIVDDLKIDIIINIYYW